MNTNITYIKLIEDFLDNKITVKQFETQYLSTFKAERGDMNKDLYLILENLFEDVDAYWEECLPENETNLMISEKTLREEAMKALVQLKKYE